MTDDQPKADDELEELRTFARNLFNRPDDDTTQQHTTEGETR